MKYFLFALALMIIYPKFLASQTITFNHDASKMNQFLVTEEGTGCLQPEVYYKLFHSSYYDSAIGSGKLSFREAAKLNALKETIISDSIKRFLTLRAQTEALNISDRDATLDLEWVIEKDKILALLDKFKKNIDKILQCGSSSYQSYWVEKYNCFNLSIELAKESYMRNSQRKQVYLSIYQDLENENSLIEKMLVYLKYNNKIKELRQANANSLNHKNLEGARDAISKWKKAAKTTLLSTSIDSK